MKPDIKMYILTAVMVFALYGFFTLLLNVGILNHFHRGLLIVICVNVMLAVSLNLSAGFLGQLVLGHAAFMAIGAYAAAIFSMQMGVSTPWGLIVSLIFGGIVAAFFGVAIGIPALRLRGDYLAIITLGFGQIVQSIVLNMNITGGPMGLVGIPRTTNFTIAFFGMAVTIAMLVSLIRSRHGRAMIAIREDEIAAEASGISTTYYKIFGFTVAAFFAGVAGGIMAHHITILMPHDSGIERSIELLVIVVLGGMGSFTGAVTAAVVLTLLPELLREFATYRMLIYSVILIVMMVYRPQGLLGSYEFSLQYVVSKLTGGRVGGQAGGQANGQAGGNNTK